MAQPEMIQVLADLAAVVADEQYSPGEVICRQGRRGDKAYAIEVGDVLVQAEVGGRKVELAHMSNGDFFGERALVGALPRAATIIAETPLHLLSLHRRDYQRLARRHPSLKRVLVGPDVVPLLRQVGLFSRLTQEELEALSEHVGVQFYRPGSRVVGQGEMGATMYVVILGDLIAYRRDEKGRARPVKALPEGTAFGETSLLVGEPRDATVVARTYTQLCYINQASFNNFLQAHPGVRNRLQVRPDVKRKWTAGSFPGQFPGETVEIRSRKHWMAFLTALAGPAFWLALCGGALLVLDALWLGSVRGSSGLATLSVLLTLLWMLMAVAISIWHWVDWRNDHYIVTTQRIVHIERVILQATTTDVVPIEQVQNVDLKQDLLGEILDYGHIRITTAGPAGTGSMELRYVCQPDAFQWTIFEQMGRDRYRAAEAERSELRRAIQRAIEPGVLEDEISEQPSPSPAERPGWAALLSRNPLVGWLRRTFTESGLIVFFRRPHLLRQEISQEDRVIWRKHWGVFLKATCRPLVLCLLCFALILLAMAGWLGGFTLLDFQPSVFGTALVVLTLSFVPILVWLLWEVEDWRNDLYIVTDTHIIDIERITPILLKETRRQARLDNIQNMTASTTGFWSSILKWGDVLIETAGEGTFEFKQVHYPDRVREEIDRRREAYRARQRREETERQRAEFAEWISVYHEVMRDQEARARWEGTISPPESLLEELKKPDKDEQEV
jgi:CRP-like cAMP-binding protein/membrane protein YdbS with pleckstrin-like domain